MVNSAPTAPATRTRRTPEQRLAVAKLEEEKAAVRLARKAQKVRQYQAVQRTRERKLDTRRKILAGALALKHMTRHVTFGAAFRELLAEHIIRDEERALFGLEPLPPEIVAAALAALKEKGETRARRKAKAG